MHIRYLFRWAGVAFGGCQALSFVTPTAETELNAKKKVYCKTMHVISADITNSNIQSLIGICVDIQVRIICMSLIQ